MKLRTWWQPDFYHDFTDSNFIWTQWKQDQHINFLKSGCINDPRYPIKLYNRIDQNKHLTNKKGIFINMKKYYYRKGSDPFNVLPLTYLVKNAQDDDFKRFEMYYTQLAQQLYRRSHKKEDGSEEDQRLSTLEQAEIEETYNTWIIKPGENSNRGIGISISDSLHEIRAIVSSQQNKTYII